MNRQNLANSDSAPFVSLDGVSMRYSTKSLFDDLSLAVHPGERIGIIGRNGSGKSTLVRLLLGELEPHQGSRSARRQITFAYVPQNFEFWAPTVAAQLLEAIEQFRVIQAKLGNSLEALTPQNMVNSALKFSNLESLADKSPGSCSGGQRKRLQIVCALLQEPNVLIMDEPTNHLDLETTEWLEEAVLSILESPRSLLWGSLIEKSWDPAFVLVSHDRSLLDTLVTSMIELDRGIAAVFEGGYESYLSQRMERETTSRAIEARAANQMRRELEWVSRGAQARSTKQRARIERAKKLNIKLGLMSQRNKEIEPLGLDFAAQSESAASMKLSKQDLIDFRKFSVSRENEAGSAVFFNELELTLRPGMRIALLGPNGCGKSTFFHAITANTSHQNPKLIFHDNARLSYFDQERTILKTMPTPRHLLLPAGGEYVRTGDRSVHIANFLGQFQFQHQDLDAPLESFSGGERARFLLARTMLDDSNVLILDEPTNDLDLWVLRDLEQSLCEFAGAILFTSHDRYFLRRVATQFLAFAGWSESGTARLAKWIMTADLEQAIEASRAMVQAKADASSGSRNKQQRDSQEQENNAAKPSEQRPKKMTYKDQFRQSELENLIPKWESERDALTAEINNLYASNASFEVTRPISDALARLNQTIDAAYDEFEQIMSRSND